MQVYEPEEKIIKFNPWMPYNSDIPQFKSNYVYTEKPNPMKGYFEFFGISE